MTVAPGIYRPDEVDYGSIPAINQSTLTAIRKSPLHYRHRLMAQNEETDAMRLGTLAHVALLEPDLVAEMFTVWTGGRRAGKAWEAFEAEAEAAGRTVVKSEDLETAFRIRDAVRAHKPAWRYLRSGRAEVVLVWRDKRTGLLCKGRMDWLSTSVPDVMCDLKTARDVSPWAFEPAFARRNYDVQAAFYADGYETLTGRPLYPKAIAVENVPPHDVIVYDLVEAIDIGRQLYQEALERVAECQQSGLWLGQCPTGERTLRLPKWRDPELAAHDDLADLELEP